MMMMMIIVVIIFFFFFYCCMGTTIPKTITETFSRAVEAEKGNSGKQRRDGTEQKSLARSLDQPASQPATQRVTQSLTHSLSQSVGGDTIRFELN